MPVLKEATYGGRRIGSLPTTLPTSSGSSLNLPNGAAKPPAALLVDILDLNSDESPVPSTSTSDFLQDLLGIGLTPIPSLSVPTGGAGILLDLLSIGTPPLQNDTSSPNMVPASQDNMPSVSPLERMPPLSSLVSSSEASQRSILSSLNGVVEVRSPGGGSPVIDLLDGLSYNPSVTGAAGALGATYCSPYIAVDGSYYTRPSGQSSSNVSSRETTTNKPSNGLKPAQRSELVNEEYGQRQNKPRRYSEMNFGQ